MAQVDADVGVQPLVEKYPQGNTLTASGAPYLGEQLLHFRRIRFVFFVVLRKRCCNAGHPALQGWMDRCVFTGAVLPQDKDEGVDGFQSLRGNGIV